MSRKRKSLSTVRSYQPEVSRRSILQAALGEFAQHGLAGARIGAIASAAGVNRALLYYYFRSKDSLYRAVLDDFFQRLKVRVSAALDTDAPAGERILLYARAHFDTLAQSPYYARLFQGEMMNAGRDQCLVAEEGGAPPSQLLHIVDDYIAPIAMRVRAVLEKGIKRREFRAVDPLQFAPTLAASIVYYFVAAPVFLKIRQVDPFSPAAIAQRRAAVLDFIAAALFADRETGLKLAAEIAARAPESGEQDPPAPATLPTAKRGKHS